MPQGKIVEQTCFSEYSEGRGPLSSDSLAHFARNTQSGADADKWADTVRYKA